jgi:hypothetical protein
MQTDRATLRRSISPAKPLWCARKIYQDWGATLARRTPSWGDDGGAAEGQGRPWDFKGKDAKGNYIKVFRRGFRYASSDFGGEKGEGYLSSEPIVTGGGSERRAGEAEGRDNAPAFCSS